MKTLPGTPLSAIGIVLGAIMLTGSAFAYDKGEGRDTLPIADQSFKPDSRTSRSFAFDNDILVPGSRDQDYTYGLNLTFSGKGAEDHWASLHEPLGWLDRKIGLDRRAGNGIESGKIEYGVFGFTPENITLTEPQQDDRPYAGLVYVASTRERYHAAGEVAWQSTLTLGILGLDIVGDLQENVHSITGSDQPQGWDNQISEGGELTARYSVARQHLLHKSGSGLEIKTTTLGSVGYLTEVSWSLSLRAGKIHTPWVSFNPELTSYGEKSNPSDLGRVSEHYFWTGFALKARAYNAFLQGQFKDSEVTYHSNELNHGIVEAWVGYTVALSDGYSFTYSIRGHTSELKQGTGDRSVIWGGLLVTKSFN